MVLVTGSFLYDSIGILTTLLAGFILYAKWKLTYWAKKGVLTEKPIFLLGNAKKVFFNQQSFGELWKDIYNSAKAKGLKHTGGYFLLKPFYVPVDLDIVKSIMQTDFQHFVDRGIYVNETDDPLSAHLFSLPGEKWRNLRMKLTPTFTSGKMKMMFSTFADCSKGLKEIVDDYSKIQDPVDIKEILQRFTIDIIVSCAFGLDSNAMKDPNTEFSVQGRKIFIPNIASTLRFLAQFSFPHDILRWFKMRATDKNISDFFIDVIKKNVNYREQQNIYRKDFMHLLLQLKNRGQIFDDEKLLCEDRGSNVSALTFNELAAQAFVFFFAGFETSSTTMTFALFELASNPEVQEKLRQEIKSVLKKYDGKLTYEAIKDMHYMDRVLQETLRKYPPLPIIPRICSKDYTVPGTDIIIEEGTMVFISALGIQNDPEIYPDPEKFDPDRFLEENKTSRHKFAWIPFGEGPRICIGVRFGLMQAKVGLTSILEDYEITLNNKTILPLKFDSQSAILSTEGGIWINAIKKK